MKEKNFLERPILQSIPFITGEVFIFALIIAFALLSRFYDLGTRVMSHDESLHTYFSWLLYKGDGYQHNPMMHGPFQFHLLALSYFLFGVSDFTARIPSVIFNIATIGMLWYWRRYLGKAGALIAGFLMLISPYILFYGRYVRNEAFSAFAGMLMFLAILRYLESGEKRYFYWLTLALVINFTSKETAFIYAAQVLVFLSAYFIWELLKKSWEKKTDRATFINLVALAVILIGATLGAGLLGQSDSIPATAEPAVPANPLAEGGVAALSSGGFPWVAVLAILTFIALAAAAYYLIQGLGWKKIREERSFDLLMLIGTLIIPLLSPIISTVFGWVIPTTSGEIAGLLVTEYVQIGVAILVTFSISIALGLWWNRDLWWKNALLFYGIFTILFTTVFTNSAGFFTGIFGSLGYWIVQQEVARGGQPWYYYIFIQIPIYEFLPALGIFIALYFGFKKKKTPDSLDASATSETLESSFDTHVITFSLLLWWVLSSVLAYSYAGERMPWLTYHITLPMILLTAWGLDQLIKSLNWRELHEKKGWMVAGLLFIFYTAISNTFSGMGSAFAGKNLDQLQATSDFLLPLIVTIASGTALFYLLREWTWKNALSLASLVAFGLLSLWTGRAAYRAAYINYDSAKEYLVYAHAATGVKDVVAQAEEISMRTNGDLGALIAYDASAPDTGISWPFVWYLRDFTNLRSFDAPTRSLRDASVIIVDAKNFDKIEPVVNQGYYRSDYIRMWWPNQDYYNLVSGRDSSLIFPSDYPCTGIMTPFKLIKSKDFSRLCEMVTNPAIRKGVIDIWADRDYTKYAQATGKESAFSATDWNPSDKMRLYIRKDIAAQIWNYGVLPETGVDVMTDPYEENTITLSAEKTVGLEGTGEGEFSAPRGIAFAPDGTFYVADSRNHRIEHFDADGKFINMWGQFGDSTFDDLPGGIFNEPWGVAVGPDGSVYVSDTWNHRIQKFEADGTPITRWGYYGQAEDGFAFWGPRGIAVDTEGNVFVSDTGNKRIVKFDSDGLFITEFGTTGMGIGEFDEQVGVAVDNDGIVYVTDTWNQRIQTFQPDEDGTLYFPLNQWDIAGWYGQSLENKPFITVDNNGSVFATDPESYRVLQFDTEGNFIRTWGDYGYSMENIGLAAAVAVDANGDVWVTDAGNHRVMKFILPEE